MSRTDEQRASEHSGHEIGRRMLDQALATDDQAQRHQLFTAAIVLCAGEDHPRDAFAGLATAIVPALQSTPEPLKGLATLAARAALAGHVCTQDADGVINISRWGRVVSFGDLATAGAWLDRVTGQKGGS